jgi:O-antigen/teichoic acid export membrane protein
VFKNQLIKHKGFKKLFASGALVQILPLLFLPILARFYAPSEFMVYALALSISAVVSPLVTLRLEHLFVRIKSTRLLKLVLFESVLTLHLLSLALSFVTVFLLGTFDVVVSFSIAYLLITGYSGFILLTNYLVRQEFFSVLATGRILRPVLELLLALLFYFQGFPEVGLLYSVAFSYFFVYVFYLLYSYKPRKMDFMLLTRFNSYKKGKFLVFFDLPSAILNSINIQAPVFIFSYFTNPIFVGLYVMAAKLAAAPSALINNSLGFIFRNKAMAENVQYSNIKISFNQLFRLTTSVALTVLVVFVVLPENFLVFLLGNDWRGVVELLHIIAPLAAIRVIAFPLCYTFYIKNKILENLYFQFGLLVLFFFFVSILNIFSFDDVYILGFFVSLMMTYYVLYLYYMYKISR